MKFRVGGWLLTVAFSALAILKLLWLGLRPMPLALVVPGMVLTTAAVIGLVLCALDSTRWARALFGFAAFAAAAQVVLELHVLDDGAGDVLAVLTFAGPAAFAGGAMLRGAGKRLPWSLIPIALLLTIVAIVSETHQRGWWSTLPLDVLCIFVALDLLGAFPVIARIPHAAIPNPALGRLVTAIGFALVAGGGWLVWVAVEESLRRSTPSSGMLLLGAVSALAGVLGLWRRRRQVSLPIVIALVVGIASSLEVFGQLQSRPFDEAVLTTRELPITRISMPSGEDAVSAFRNAGLVTMTPDHVGLDEMGVSWGFESDLAFTEADLTMKVDGVNVEVVIGVVDGQAVGGGRSHRMTFLAWTCDGVKLRASFGASGTLARVQALATRIGKTIECVAPSPAIPAVSIPVSLPPNFRELEISENFFRTFRSMDHEIAFSLAWTKDTNWYETIQNRPVDMFRWFVREDLLETAGEPVRTTLLIDGEYRWLAELELLGRRRLVAVYYCRALGVYAAAGYDGPSSMSIESAIDLVRAPGCP